MDYPKKNKNFLDKILRRNKLGALVSFLFLFLLFAPTASATILTYPKLPGALTPQEIASRPPSLQLALLINYYIRLFYLIAIILAVGSLIYAGIFYFISRGKPLPLSKAKKAVSQSFLGLLIIILSYAILALINPQILIFKTPGQPQPAAIYTPPARESNQVRFIQVALGTILENAISSIEETTTTPSGIIRKIEIPFISSEKDLGEAISITREIKENLAGCRCGTSKVHAERNGLLYKCVGGRDKTRNILGAEAQIISKAKGSQKKCRQENCYDCGLTINQPDGTKCDLEKVAKLRKKLAKTLAKLNADQIKLSPQQLEEISKTLKANAARFLLFNLNNIQFENNFENDKSIEEDGLKREVVRPKQFPKPRTVHMSPGIIDPLTFYAPVSGPLPAEMIANNKKSYRKAKTMMSLYSVLTQMSAEDIQAMVQDCLQSAFGNGSFALDKSKLKELVEKATKEGISDFIGSALSKKADEMANKFVEKIKEENRKIIKENVKKEGVIPCPLPASAPPGSKCNAISPNFLSDKLSDILTKPISQFLPGEIRKDLNQQLRTTIFGKPTDAILRKGVRAVLDNALNGALSKNLTDQIPWLKEQLEKRMFQVLPDLAAIPLENIDVFLYANLHNLRRRINDKIEDVANEIGNQLSQPAVDIIENFKKRRPELFRENLEPDNCWRKEWPKRYYDYGSHRCKETSPDDFTPDNNGGTFMSKIKPNVITWESNGGGDRSELGYQTGMGDSGIASLCRRAGFSWNDIDNKCEDDQDLNLGNLKPTKENFKRFLKNFAVGLVNFTEQFMVALTQTAVYTMTKYTQVWVDDTIITPIQPYLDKMQDFQQSLHKFLNSTIANILPQKISSYLQGSVFGIIDDLCHGKKTTIDVYGKKIIFNTGDTRACRLNEKIKTDIVNFASPEVKKFLNARGIDLLGKNAKELNNSLASILFPGIKNIDKIIKGTPKQIICGEISIGGGTLSQKCSANQDSSFFLPKIKKSSGLNKEEKEKCYLIFYTCQNPFRKLDLKGGAMVTNIIKASCRAVETGCKNNCSVGCPDEKTKKACFACKAMTKESIFYSMLKGEVEMVYGTPSSNQQDEILTYQWFAAAMPERIGDIDKLAKERGLYALWTKKDSNGISPRDEAYNNGKGNDSILTDPNYTGLQIIAWFSSGKELKDLLSAPPLGIMSYFLGENYKGENILGISLSDSVSFNKGICNRVRREWDAAKRDKNEAKVDELEPNMEACLAINRSPIDAFGASKPLINYVRPNSYKIMFTLIHDMLKPEERPEPLNRLLSVLFNENVSFLIKKIGGNQPWVGWLTSPLRNYLTNEEIGKMVFGGYWNKKVTPQLLSDIQTLLGKKPIDLIGNIGKKIKAPNALRAPIEILAGKYPVLNERYVDLLGNKLGLTDKAKKLFDKAGNLNAKINSVATSSAAAVQNVFKAAIIDYPKKATQAIVGSLSRKLGIGVGGEAADQISGVCHPATSLSGCAKDEVYNQTSKECCSLGGALSCAPICREKPAGANCLLEQGEEEKTETVGGETKHLCCFNNNCQRCRRATHKEVTNKACFSAGGKTESLVSKVINGENKNLCCWNDLAKDVGGKKYCCTNVIGCISRKFTYHLQMLGDVLMDGPLLDELIPSENQ